MSKPYDRYGSAPRGRKRDRAPCKADHPINSPKAERRYALDELLSEAPSNPSVATKG
ncbi:hypothetical protein [Methylosinus sp. LW3]|uniref:hypothetical protein n=1 Tax=Methylosinus sp. LW3 TaxID=107635 RepID=UPI0004BCCDB3|nr:hypothetical protein [Methylosinus sp. LW3]